MKKKEINCKNFDRTDYPVVDLRNADLLTRIQYQSESSFPVSKARI